MSLPTAYRVSSASMKLIDSTGSRSITLDSLPFSIGRSTGCGLVLRQSFVSRAHAVITRQGKRFLLEDAGSRHGTFVNGQQVAKRLLTPGDIVQFGSLEGPQVRFATGVPHEAGVTHEAMEDATQQILTQLNRVSAGKSDLEKLRCFLEAARELHDAGQLDRVLHALLTATLKLANVERGYVFLADEEGALQLAMGLDARGNMLGAGSTVSRTILRQAAEATDQFIVTDTLSAEGSLMPESLAAHSMRAVICIPLRQSRQSLDKDKRRQLLGVLYLDSRYQTARFDGVDRDLLRTIARDAEALIENAQLASIEEQARLQREELRLAAGIQQGLMAMKAATLPFAKVEAHNLPCSAVGGDFFDVIPGKGVLNVAFVDVSGKGMSAAILASTLQGMLYVQLQAMVALDVIAAAVNEYLCTKNTGKYATMILLRLYENGTLDYINCGHVHPRVCSHGVVSKLAATNLPVGLLAEATYAAASSTLAFGSRLILTTDGVTEAENASGEFYGDERLDEAALCVDLRSVLDNLQTFCAGYPATDDCTVVQITMKAASCNEKI